MCEKITEEQERFAPSTSLFAKWCIERSPMNGSLLTMAPKYIERRPCWIRQFEWTQCKMSNRSNPYAKKFLECSVILWNASSGLSESFTSHFLLLWYEWLSLFSILTESLWSHFKTVCFPLAQKWIWAVNIRLCLNIQQRTYTYIILLDSKKKSSLVYSSHR